MEKKQFYMGNTFKKTLLTIPATVPPEWENREYGLNVQIWSQYQEVFITNPPQEKKQASKIRKLG